MATLRVTLGEVNITDHLLFVMRKVLDPLADDYTQLFSPAGNNTVRKFVVINRDPVNFYVDWYRSNASGDKLGLLHTTEVDLLNNDQQVLDTIEFLVDGGRTGTPHYDPVSGASQYVNPDLDGLSYTVFKLGYGPLTWGVDIDPVVGGGFTYINGDSLADNERYTLFINRKTSVPTNSGGKGFPEDFLLFNTDITFGTSHYGMMLEANGAANLVVTIADISAIPDKTKFGINTDNGTQPYVIVVLPDGAFCMVNGKPRNPILIGRGEQVEFMKKGGVLKNTSWTGDHHRVGQRVKADGTPPVNSVATIGGWYPKPQVLRLLKWHIEELPGGEVLTGVDDSTPSATDRSKYIIGDDKVWVQDRGGYTDRNVDPDNNIDADVRKSGSIQAPQVGAFSFSGKIMKKAGQSNSLVVMANINDVNLGDQTINFNVGKENRVANVASCEYVII